MLNNSWPSNDVSIMGGFVLFIVHYAQVCESSELCCKLILHESGSNMTLTAAVRLSHQLCHLTNKWGGERGAIYRLASRIPLDPKCLWMGL